MDLFDILKSQAGVPVDDVLAILFVIVLKSPVPAGYVGLYDSTDKAISDSDGKKIFVRG